MKKMSGLPKSMNVRLMTMKPPVSSDVPGNSLLLLSYGSMESNTGPDLAFGGPGAEQEWGAFNPVLYNHILYSI
jgi:hypothetical protein